jgi:CRP/FNR family transcriptional regulator, cyclic AMP receptor protein
MALNPPEPDALSRITHFWGVPILELERLAPLLHERVFSTGYTIISADEPGEAVYVILSGSAKMHVIRPDGTEVILAVLGPGEVVGEMSIADSFGRSADVATVEESVLLWMYRVTFSSNVQDSPALARNLAKMLSRRVRLTNAHLLSLAALDVPIPTRSAAALSSRPSLHPSRWRRGLFLRGSEGLPRSGRPRRGSWRVRRL